MIIPKLSSTLANDSYMLCVLCLQAAMKVPEVAANMALRYTAMMGLGTITNKMYWAHWKMAAPKAATAPVVKQVIEVGLAG